MRLLTALSGPAFYQAKTMPRAPCPLCALEKEDSSDKTLFQIDDLDNGQLHSEVPKDYFTFPPTRLGDNDPGMQALRVSLPRAYQGCVAEKRSSNSFLSCGSRYKRGRSLISGRTEKDRSGDASRLSNFYIGIYPALRIMRLLQMC